jgi:hypothetical protein
MKNYIQTNFISDISNGWIIGCSLLACGMVGSTYINGISNLCLLHSKNSYRNTFVQINDNFVNNEKKLFNSYFNSINISFIVAITGLTIYTFNKNRK